MQGGGFDRRVPLKNDFVWAQARALKLELLRIRRHRLVLVCFARLALAPYPIVLADAPPSAIPAYKPYPIVLANALPTALPAPVQPYLIR